MLRLLLRIALAFAPAAPALAQTVYPAGEVMDAFKAACSQLDGIEAANAQVAASGWTPVADAATTPVGELLAFGRAEGEKRIGAAGGKLLQGGVFAREVAGEQLYIIVSGVSVGGNALIGCRLYDPGETRRIERAAAVRWLGREPDDAVESAEFVKYAFTPGLVADQRDFEVYFLPAGSPLVATLKISGVGLAATKASKAADTKEQK